jgi:hypothetical protein
MVMVARSRGPGSAGRRGRHSGDSLAGVDGDVARGVDGRGNGVGWVVEVGPGEGGVGVVVEVPPVGDVGDGVVPGIAPIGLVGGRAAEPGGPGGELVLEALPVTGSLGVDLLARVHELSLEVFSVVGGVAVAVRLGAEGLLFVINAVEGAPGGDGVEESVGDALLA